MERILIYTDGSSRGNPGKGGWGAIVATHEEVVELGGFETLTTNNRMELEAVHEALIEVARLPELPLIVRTDSAYVINGATKWSHGWKRRGWKTLDNKDVSNRDLWEPFLEVLEKVSRRIVWENVGGHIAIPGNERADVIATSFALSKPTELYVGDRGSYTVDLEQVNFDPELKQKRSEVKARQKQKAYSYVSAVAGVVMVHKTWDECKKCVEGKKARYKKSLSAADEAAVIKEFSQ